MSLKDRVKATIVKVNNDTASIVVCFYTDIIKNHYETEELPAREKNIRDGNPDYNEEQVKTYVRDHYPMGITLNVTPPPHLSGRELIDFVLSHADYGFLEYKEDLILGIKPDLSVAEEILGYELTVIPHVPFESPIVPDTRIIGIANGEVYDPFDRRNIVKRSDAESSTVELGIVEL